MSTQINPVATALTAATIGTYISEMAGAYYHGNGHATPQEERPAPDLEAVVGHVNAAMTQTGTKISFSVDRATKETVVTVVDSETGKVIRQIPSEVMLKIAKHITDMLGVLLDKAV